MTQPTFPITFASYWGTGPDKDDTATELSFQTPEAFNAFMTGVNNADGWFGATFVSHANFRVNKDGEIVENKQRSTPTDCQRFVVWGDSPESGSRAEKFQFDTPEQAQAFQEGVEHTTTTRASMGPTSFEPMARLWLNTGARANRSPMRP